MTMKGFLSAKAYVRDRGIVRTNIGIENGRISFIGDSPEELQALANTGDYLLVPGLIDEHVHGAGGADAMDGTQHALSVLSETLAEEGTTSFLATTMTQSDESIQKALKAVAEWKGGNGARLLGVHLEGPFISAKHVGAQPLEHVKSPSVAYFQALQAAAGNRIRLVTLAPEEDRDCSLISYLKGQEIVPSVGHSDATEEEVTRAIASGLSCVTHTYNAQTPLHHREIGVAGAALLHDELCCEVIADLIHVSIPALKLLRKNKPAEKLVLITDAMRAKGMGNGIFELGGQEVFVKDGQARLKDGTLAGSVLKMNEGLRNLVRACGVPLEEALDCASYNPAKNLGIEGEYGAIKQGAMADFALLDDDFNVKMTVVGGNIVFKNCP